MLSIVFVGPSMSGKTDVCLSLAQQNTVCTGITQSASYVAVQVNGSEWHFWDTPGVSLEELQGDTAWIAQDIFDEADVIVICYDGRTNYSPIAYARACGVDRCIILRTRGAQPCHDLWYFVDYLRLTTSRGQLVPLVSLDSSFFCVIRQVASHFPTKGLANFVALV